MRSTLDVPRNEPKPRTLDLLKAVEDPLMFDDVALRRLPLRLTPPQVPYGDPPGVSETEDRLSAAGVVELSGWKIGCDLIAVYIS